MVRQSSDKKWVFYLISGLAGCILMGAGDWLMIYGDTAYEGNLAWLTVGVAQIAPWRNALAMALAFPAVLFYCIALFGIRMFFRDPMHRKVYTGLTAVGMTPWLSLHLFYTMILYLFSWMCSHGHTGLAHAAGEALFQQFWWLVPVGEALMLLPFLYMFCMILCRKSIFSRWMAFNNPLVVYLVLKTLTEFLPDVPARLAFVNGLMSESMAVCFVIFMIAVPRALKSKRR